jgi:tRNA-2-methylthio-N6-dimethylallyladenosine synthase
MPQNKPKYYLMIFGCQMNYSDAERLATVLKKIGYQETKQENEADLIIALACAVRQKAVDRIYGKFHNWQLKRKGRPFITALSGCVLPIDRKKLTKKFDLFIDIKNLKNLAQDLQAISAKKLNLPDFFNIPPDYSSHYRAFVPIMTGCNKFCTYCAVPYTRGREVSRPSTEIIKEVKQLLANGYKEIILLGQNVNSYGLDKKRSLPAGRQEIRFPELLKKIDSLGKNFWLKFLTSHPYDMSNQLLKVMAQGQNINHYLHLPVQSGSNKILKRMNRHYTVAQYIKLIQKIKKTIPDIAISTDIIVGFCGETAKDYQATEKLVSKIGYNMAYFSQYSSRTGTTASKLYEDDVPAKTKKARWEKMNKIIAQQSLAFNKKLLGQNKTALIDVVKKKDSQYLNIGKLDNYVPVHIYTNEPLRVGDFVKVTINKALAWGVQAELAKKKIIVVLGPTASGKSALAVKLAKKFKGEIISADSRQIYKGLDIASNKITTKEMAGIPHHLLDISQPNKKINLYHWQQLTFQTIAKILAKNKLPILVGGTGLYLCSILQNYDLHPKNPALRECPYDFLIFGLNPDRAKLYKKINARAEKMIEDGSLKEVKQLYKKYKNKKLTALTGIGYREIIEHLEGKISLAQAIEKIKQNTRHYAKRQMTWFRRMERQGLKIYWNQNLKNIEKISQDFLNK